MKKLKLRLLDQWEDQATGNRYCEVKIGKYEACCIKNLDFMKFDGKEVYSDIGGPDFPLRNLESDEKTSIIDFVTATTIEK